MIEISNDKSNDSMSTHESNTRESKLRISGTKLNILIACEFSGIVTKAFNDRGHHAISIDLLPTEGNVHTHLVQDIIKFLEETDGDWDLMIAHPPCTYTAVTGSRWYKDDPRRQEGVEFFKKLYNADIPHIAVEHPVSVVSGRFRKPDQYIQPWEFGHGETKKTGLWLKNLPLLKPTNIVNGRHPRVWLEPPSKDRWKNRSRTYQGIANAMADQWGASIA